MAVSRTRKRLPARRGAAPPGGRRDGADPRANQRERTRTAILEAALEIMRRGQVPSIAEVAEAARVSRATAYRYFGSFGELLSEAVSRALIDRPEWEERLAGHDDPTERVEAMISATFDAVTRSETVARAWLLLSLDQWARLQAGEELEEGLVQRGGRRVGIEIALDSFRDTLDEQTASRLEVALSLLAGAETHVVMKDIWDLDDAEAKEVSLWVARAVTRAALEEGRKRTRRR